MPKVSSASQMDKQAERWAALSGVHIHSPFPRRYVNRLIARELSRFVKYYDGIIQWMPRKEDTGELLAQTTARVKRTIPTGHAFPDLRNERDQRTAILLNGTINHHFDIEDLLRRLKNSLSRTSRVILIAYNPYFSWLYCWANYLGIRQGPLPSTFLTRVDLINICKLSGYDLVRIRPVVHFPFRMLGIGDLLNRWLAATPGMRWLGLVYVCALRPVLEETLRPSLTCVIPARNERGNIENALRRMPDLGCPLEVIFVEGHSTDGTWEEIQRVTKLYQGKFQISSYKQTGKGKSDAVRLGFSKASGDLLTILDADLTMPPELLGRFYEAYRAGLADFVNGSRLVYPTEGEAMRFLNKLGNVFFAKVVSWVLDQRLGDTLCGTKLLARHDYLRMVAWRNDFGDFDPFGDFELIFPAASLMLSIVDVPIRYRDRTYGSTNINRFRHGFMLARMTLIGFLRIRMGAR